MLVISWQPQSYAIKVIEANLTAILQRECNNRQLETISHSPISQDPLEIAMIVGDSGDSTTPLDTLYHSTLKIIFSYYKCWDFLPQQDGTHKVSMITTASLHPDLVPRHDVRLPLGHDWPSTMRMSQEAYPMTTPWNITALHHMHICSW